ncbi:MAG TPA: glycosyltransferase family 39 protein [Actinoplanes sp.]|nr:glycosyltransferase family 39 protein [Actinoplanes sp.]
MTGRQPSDVPVTAAGAGLNRLVVVVAALVFVELMAFAGRYGYHGDEMYFIVAGSHPAFGYPDQPPLVPLLAGLMHHIAASLYLLRLPSAVAAAATVVVAGLTARDAGGGARAQVIAACVAAVSAISLATGHFVTTTTFDVLFTALLGWLLVRALMRHDPRPLVWAGVVVGVGFEAKPQVGFVAAAAVVALAVVGPRWVFRSRHLWAGVVIAVVLGAPYLIWQQRHGWPQLTVAGNVAGSAEGGRVGFFPFQLVMVSVFLVPVWVSGLVAAWRAPALRVLRFVPVLYGMLAVAYLLGDGKAYYLASLYPTLIGLGSIPTAAWLTRGARQWWRWASLGTAVVLSALISAVLALPLLPERDLPDSATIALNPDLGNEVGWPQFIDTISAVWHALPPATRAHAVIFTGSYSEAGAVDVLGGRDGLPHAFSGHNGFSLWDEPRPDQTTTIAIGYGSPQQVSRYFTGCRVVGRISNPVKLDNGEYGGPVLQCSGLTAPWAQLWPRLRHYE